MVYKLMLLKVLQKV